MLTVTLLLALAALATAQNTPKRDGERPNAPSREQLKKARTLLAKNCMCADAEARKRQAGKDAKADKAASVSGSESGESGETDKSGESLSDGSDSESSDGGKDRCEVLCRVAEAAGERAVARESIAAKRAEIKKSAATVCQNLCKKFETDCTLCKKGAEAQGVRDVTRAGVKKARGKLEAARKNGNKAALKAAREEEREARAAAIAALDGPGADKATAVLARAEERAKARAARAEQLADGADSANGKKAVQELKKRFLKRRALLERAAKAAEKNPELQVLLVEFQVAKKMGADANELKTIVNEIKEEFKGAEVKEEPAPAPKVSSESSESSESSVSSGSTEDSSATEDSTEDSSVTEETAAGGDIETAETAETEDPKDDPKTRKRQAMASDKVVVVMSYDPEDEANMDLAVAQMAGDNEMDVSELEKLTPEEIALLKTTPAVVSRQSGASTVVLSLAAMVAGALSL